MKFLTSDMPNSPVLTGSAGSLTDLLDALLINGFGTKAASALVVAAGVATLTTTAAHSAVVGSTITVAGATPAALNGEKVVTAISPTSVSFATALADQAASGSISFKMAPLGWVIAYSGSNVRAYKPSSPEATGCLLRVEGGWANNAWVQGYQTMSDINTGGGLFPSTGQGAGGGMYWPTSDANNTAARRWVLAGDERGFYICVAPGAGYQRQMTTHWFGDINALRSGDAYACLLTGSVSSRVGLATLSGGDVGYSQRPGSAEGGKFFPRAFTGIGGSVAADLVGSSHNSATNLALSGGSGYSFGTFPNNVDNGLLLGRIAVFGSGGYRGTMPGAWHLIQDASGAFSTGDIINGAGELAGRRLMAITVGGAQGGSTGTWLIDVTGPWRT